MRHGREASAVLNKSVQQQCPRTIPRYYTALARRHESGARRGCSVLTPCSCARIPVISVISVIGWCEVRRHDGKSLLSHGPAFAQRLMGQRLPKYAKGFQEAVTKSQKADVINGFNEPHHCCLYYRTHILRVVYHNISIFLAPPPAPCLFCAFNYTKLTST